MNNNEHFPFLFCKIGNIKTRIKSDILYYDYSIFEKTLIKTVTRE